MEFPTIVYRVPGRHLRPHGTYDYAGANTQEEFDAKLSEGWYESLPAAIEGKSSEPVLDDSAPPTREELETKATELGIKFDGRYSDKKIAQMIDESLAK
jgi:hypothetical protein